MELVVFIDIAIVLVIMFFVMKKYLNFLENVFRILLLEFIFTSYCAILSINFEVWKVDKAFHLYYCFALYEVMIVPIAMLIILNLLPFFKTLKKVMISLLGILVIYMMEFLMVQWGIITYQGWHAWQSVLSLLSLLIGVHTFSYLFSKLVIYEVKENQ
ncbi:hypothetical protein [Aquibacillus kalidii]|uniref:hypothetical protein n=1 Tax=Aquibacillus kalidii TaxID=2762597 RepID=UPI001647C349|nr:hypothetical protein [Aquibacillus kalidii]